MSPRSGAEAEITLHYQNEGTAKAIADAVNPDNYQAPQGMEVTIKRSNSQVDVCIKCSKGVGSLISTIDDLLSCFAAAEKALNSTM